MYAGVPYSLRGVPYSTPELTVKDFREKLKCIDSVFGPLTEEFRLLEAYHSEYKAHANEINLKLNECEKLENPEQ